MSKTNLNEEDVLKLIQLYDSEIKSTHKLGEYFKIGHKKVRSILIENGIEINKKGGQEKNGNSKEIEQSKINRYTSNEKELIAVCKETGKSFSDINNLSGSLTEHIKKMFNLPEIPSNSYQRKKYEIENGKKWFEKYFDIIEIEKNKIRKCKLCEWETIDIENKSGMFETHIKKHHNLNIKDYLNLFPEDITYHNVSSKSIELDRLFNDEETYIICKLCGEKMKVISNTHLNSKHNISSQEYKLMFPNEKLTSKRSTKIFRSNSIEGNKNITPTWTSTGEIEIKEFIESLGFVVEKSRNRKLLDGKEIDLIIPSIKLGIEYDGLYFHTEKMGKNSTYHLDKTIECNKIGYNLIHIFEDEWKTNNNLIKSKLKHILKINEGIKLGGRNVQIKKIESKEKSVFLNENHIQGNDSSPICYGAFYNEELVGVITFNNNRNMTKTVIDEYELTRYSIKDGYIINGLAPKFLKQFIVDYSPKNIISFADRRWTLDPHNNLYTKIGFKLIDITRPNYFYYNSKVDRYKRHHKFGFGKNSLKRKYPNLDFNKTEKELTTELGYDRIWDCGLFKYEMKLQ